MTTQPTHPARSRTGGLRNRLRAAHALSALRVVRDLAGLVPAVTALLLAPAHTTTGDTPQPVTLVILVDDRRCSAPTPTPRTSTPVTVHAATTPTSPGDALTAPPYGPAV
ncbi:hypothetical protein [Streptomyces buecherae]|uniref:hypothetical protein n=1 Tax=Streptomyces buecherae TaxID=2763006 RepID=UPI001C261441|nr:hypothetical protein [Streptomyces buecherae]